MLFEKKSITAGLYVGSSSYVYLALECAGGVTRAAASFSDVLPESLRGGLSFSASADELSDVFRFVAASVKPARKRPVYFAVPMTESLLRIVPMPGLTCAEARKAFRYEVERHFPFGSDDCVYDLDEIDYPVGGGASERRFTVSAARRAAVEAVYAAARSQGLRFSVMEPEQTALERAAASDAPRDGGCVLLYAGFERSLLIFLWRGCGIFYRNISFPYGFDWGSLDDAAADIAGKVRASVAFGLSRNDGFSFDSLRIFGPGASGRLCAALMDAFPECAVSVVFPERRFGLDFPADEGWTAALGLALREYDSQA